MNIYSNNSNYERLSDINNNCVALVWLNEFELNQVVEYDNMRQHHSEKILIMELMQQHGFIGCHINPNNFNRAILDGLVDIKEITIRAKGIRTFYETHQHTYRAISNLTQLQSLYIHYYYLPECKHTIYMDSYSFNHNDIVTCILRKHKSTLINVKLHFGYITPYYLEHISLAIKGLQSPLAHISLTVNNILLWPSCTISAQNYPLYLDIQSKINKINKQNLEFIQKIKNYSLEYSKRQLKFISTENNCNMGKEIDKEQLVQQKLQEIISNRNCICNFAHSSFLSKFKEIISSRNDRTLQREIQCLYHTIRKHVIQNRLYKKESLLYDVHKEAQNSAPLNTIEYIKFKGLK